MKRRAFLASVIAAICSPRAGLGQQTRVSRIGVIIHNTAWAATVEGLRRGLKELEVVDGKDIALDVFDAKGETKAVEEAARRFEHEGVQLIYCAPTAAAIVVKRVTANIPVVFFVGTDPVASGLVNSYAKPGGRFTGVHYLTTDLTAKRLELLKDLLPKVRRVVTFYRPGYPPAEASAKILREAAERLRIQVIERHVRSVGEMRTALGALKAAEADALFMVSDAFVVSHAQLVMDAAKAIRMPVIANELTLVEDGALMSYGVDNHEGGRQSAKYVQRILAGTRPGDLPVENATQFIAVLNRRTARDIGLSVPPAMLVRFDRVIE